MGLNNDEGGGYVSCFNECCDVMVRYRVLCEKSE